MRGIIHFCGLLTKIQLFQPTYEKNIGQTQIEDLFRKKNLTKVKFINGMESLRTIPDYDSKGNMMTKHNVSFWIKSWNSKRDTRGNW